MTLRSTFTQLMMAAAMVAGTTSSANALVLTFEGLQNQEQILNFYNGGTGGLGSSGSNYGISFGSDALALIDSDDGGSGNFANEPSPNTVAFFVSGPGVVMNVAAGFTAGFAFYYSSSVAGSVDVYDGLNGTGTLLVSIALDANSTSGGCTGDPNGLFCHWDPIGVAFGGSAKSVNFGGTANYVAFDNITLGFDVPQQDIPTPEPATLALLGLGITGFGVMRRRRGA